MKKMIAVALCLVFALSAVGCGDSGTKTNIEQIHYDYPPMVMFNGILYSAASYSGAKDSLTLVGEIESYVSDKPTENNQANDNLVGCEIYTTTSAPEYIFVLYNGSYATYKATIK